MIIVPVYMFDRCNTRELTRRLGGGPKARSFIFESIHDKRNPMPHTRVGRGYEFSWEEVKAWF